MDEVVFRMREALDASVLLLDLVRTAPFSVEIAELDVEDRSRRCMDESSSIPFDNGDKMVEVRVESCDVRCSGSEE